MNKRSGSEDTSDAVDVLVAARPQVPAELTSPDTPEANALLQRILSDHPAPPQRRSRRSAFTVIVGAAAAAVVIGILTTVNRGDPPQRAVSTASAPIDTRLTPSAVPTPESAEAWPAIRESPPVSDLNTARATIINDSPWNAGRVEYVMADGDVSLLIHGPGRSSGPDGGPANQGPPLELAVIAENRYVAGEWYFHLPGENGDMQWTYDANDEAIFVGLSPADPRELYDRLSPAAAFEAEGTDFVRGLETVHLVATAPEAIDPSLVQFDGGGAEAVTSLDLWLDSDGIVRRVDVTYSVPSAVATDDRTGETIPPDGDMTWSKVSIEFYDIGEPITIDVPRNAEEIDAVG